MKLILTNATSANVGAIKALIVVATNLVPTTTRYVPDSVDTKYIQGYMALNNAYFSIAYNARTDFVPAANPFEAASPEARGYNSAVKDLQRGELQYKKQVIRYQLEATGNSPADINLLIRFVHTLGKTYQNVDVTIED